MKNFFLILGLISVGSLAVQAEFTVSDTTNEEYLKNHGYSEATIWAVDKSKARTNGEPLVEHVENEYYNQPVVKWFRKFVMYVDPTLDDHSFMTDHEIHTSPNYEDL